MSKIKKKQAEEEEKEETTEEETEEETETSDEETEEEESDDEEIKKAAKSIESYLGLKELKKEISGIKSALKGGESLKEKLFSKEDIKPLDVAKMSKEEKIVKFFGALLRGDNVALKALSEGTAADGKPQVSFAH